MIRKMKNSGIEWIGDIPEAWRISRIKYVADFDPSCDFSMLSPDSVITYTPMENIKNGYYIPNTAVLGSLSTSLTAYRDNDIVMAKVTPCFENGNIAVMSGLSSGAGLGSSELFVFRVKGMQTRYLFYWLQNHAFVEQAKATMTGTGGLKRVSPQFVRDCAIHCPPVDEQSRIADYLDIECAQIDAVIEQTRASIEEYRKLKQSVITQAVTKGIRPGRKMKDSGAEWIGVVPEEWAVTKLKYFSSIRSGITLGKTYPRDTKLVEYPYLRVANVQGSYTDLTDVATILVTEEEAEKYRLHDGELLMTEGGDRDKLGRGTVWHAEIDPCLHQNHVFALTTNDDLSAEYVSFLSSSLVGRDYFDVTANQSVHLASTNSTTIMNFTIPVPSIEEQNEIVSYLTVKSADLEKLIAKKQTLIFALESYKKTLIFEYVTGKKEVV